MTDSPDLAIFGDHAENTLAQMRECLSHGSAIRGVLCADGHLGYAQPVGGVIAYSDHISVSGVGFDIGCGNMAVKLDTKASDLSPMEYHFLADDIQKHISFGVGRVNEEKVDHALFESDAWVEADVAHLKQMARDQLGTVGSGNHYVDIFRDEDEFLWIGVHFGSRGLGHKIATKYIKAAGGQDGINVPPALIPLETDLASAYIRGMTLAGNYAYAGREWVVERVRQMIGGTVVHEVHNHHNYAWLEQHGGEYMWVVRKGATPAFPGQQGFIGGSMGDDAVIVEGLDTPECEESLRSTVHGAGRLHGRMAAKGKKDKKTGEWKREPLFTVAQMDEWLQRKGVVRRGADVDESPMAYRRLADVLPHHADTIRVVHTLTPLIAVMAGDDVYDPFKD